MERTRLAPVIQALQQPAFDTCRMALCCVVGRIVECTITRFRRRIIRAGYDVRTIDNRVVSDVVPRAI